MVITVHCSKCQTPYKVDDKFVGQKVKCRKCAIYFFIGGADPVPLSDDDANISPDPVALPTEDPFLEASFKSTVVQKQKTPTWRLPKVELVETADDFPSDKNIRVVKSGRARASALGKMAGGLTPFIILLYVAASILFGIYMSVQVFYHPKVLPVPLAMAFWHVWGWVAMFDLSLFMFAGPLTLLGVWGTSRIFEFSLVDSAYIRACASAAIPTILVFLALPNGAQIVLLVFLIAAPIFYFGVKYLFDLDWVAGTVAAALAAMGLALAVLLQSGILNAILLGNYAIIMAGEPGVTSVAQANDTSPQPSSPVIKEEDALKSFSEMVNRETTRDLSSAMREDIEPIAVELRRRLDALSARYSTNPDFPLLAADVAAFEKRVEALPSGKVDPLVYSDPTDTDDWTTSDLSRGKLGAETQFKNFRIQPPTNATLDPNSSPDSGMTWVQANFPHDQITISTRPRGEHRQKRPVVSTSAPTLQSAQAAGLLTVNADPANVSYGMINDHPFTRVMASWPAGGHAIDYYSPIDDQWLVIHLVVPGNDDGFSKVMEAAARTVRQAKAPETP